MKNLILISIIIFSIFGCARKEKKNNIEVNSMNESKDTGNLDANISMRLIDFLNNPIDLVDFKIRKKGSNSGMTNQNNLYYKPIDSLTDGVYYSYSLFPSDNPILYPQSPVSMIVYKYGGKKHIWCDNNEILVELNVYGKDCALLKSDLVGLEKHTLIDRFGNSFFKVDEKIVYAHQNKFAVFSFNVDTLEYYRYWNTKYQQIDSTIIKDIIQRK